MTPAGDAVPFDLGESVVDGDDDDPDPAVVVNCPDATAEEWDVDGEHTVATFPGNREYPDAAPVVVVVFADVLRDTVGEYAGEEPLALSDLSDRRVPFYAFPAPRLVPADAGDSSEDTDTDEGSTPTPDPALETLAEELRGRGVSVDLDADAGVLRAEKLGEKYTIHPDGTVSGDGAVRDRLEAVTREVVA